jgi:hypothetical protein
MVMALVPSDDSGKAMISAVESALLSGKSLNVLLDDNAISSSTYCIARWVQLIP